MRDFLRNASHTYESFSHSGRAVFLFFAAVSVISSIALVYLLNISLLVAVPATGGSFTEGIIGAPRFINPILAVSDSDHDLTSLIYSGLLKASPNGDYVPDLAQSYTISDDGKTYTFALRPDATFHDGTPVTAADVVFTIAKSQNPAIKSPVRANWDGVTLTEIDARTVQFVLKAPYAPFIENTTLGILPKARWQSVSDEEFSFSDLNTSPIGSGSYKIGSISRTASGIPSTYELKPFSGYALGAPYLGRLTFRFYQSENALIDALKNNEIEAASGISPATLGELKDFTVTSAPLNRVFGVFFNQNQSVVLRDRDVRQALNDAVDRDALIAQVLGGFGTPLTGPVPPNLFSSASSNTGPQLLSHAIPFVSAAQTTNTAVAQPKENLALTARAYLLKKGWVVGSDGTLRKTTGTGKNAVTQTLAFSLATDNVPELRAAAQYLREQWQTMGAKINVQIYDQGDISQNVIRPRKYDALLFGEVIGREVDLFAFWHSSQRNDPGLNIAAYANSTADKLLTQLRTTTTDSQRTLLYNQFNVELQKDVPAVFLYAPDFVYIVPNDLAGLDLGFIEAPSDRFLSASSWYRQSDAVWSIFARGKDK
ncbi:MAG: peptide ABC transporter substrate-binding protein [bacterium]|nr:peptide ABC transporter substrate-binding protein [bacterium]